MRFVYVNMIKIINSKPHIVLKKFFNPRSYRGFFRFNSLVVVAVLAFSLNFFSSCNEFDDEIGLNLIDNRLQVSSTDTLTLIAITQSEDSLIARQADLHLLGFINDPVFGKTRASIYSEALPRDFPPTFEDIHPDSLLIDSVVLSIAYNGYFGDISQEQYVRVFELNDTIPLDSVYTNRTLTVKQEIGVNNPSFLPLPEDSVTVGLDSIEMPPHLRINLDTEFGQRFFDDREILEGMSIYDDFRGYFKGFLITVDEIAEPGAMLYFNLGSAYSRLQVFYRKTGQANNHTFSLYLDDPLGRKFTHYDNFDHAFADNAIRAQVIEGDTLLGDSLLFVQSMSNFKVNIQMPYIEELLEGREGDIAINSAKLILPVDNEYLQDTLEIARSLFLYREDPEIPGEITNLDDQFVAPGYFGGALDEDKMEYVFNITQHLQAIFDDPSMNTPLIVRVSGSVQNAGRVVLKGPGRDNPLRIEIKYTQSNN